MGVPSKEWEKENEFETKLGGPFIAVRAVKNAKVVLQDLSAGSIYVENIKEKTTRKVVDGKNPYYISNCTTLDDGRIVCGTCNAEIVIYNPKWKHQSTIVLTRQRRGNTTWVTTDKDGMIVAVVWGSATIYVYNPDDGELVRTVSFSGGPIYRIGCLSSGDMVVHTNCSRGNYVCVMGGSGVVKSTGHFRGKILRSIAVDKLTDLIYVMYNEGKECAVDVMSATGSVIAEKMLSISTMKHCSITNTGKLVVGTGSTISVYRQTMKTVIGVDLFSRLWGKIGVPCEGAKRAGGGCGRRDSKIRVSKSHFI